MGNLTKIERSLSDIESHLKVIASGVSGTKDIQVVATACNTYYRVDGVFWIESEKKFSGIEITVYIKESIDIEKILDELESCEKDIKQQFQQENIMINYVPIDAEKPI